MLGWAESAYEGRLHLLYEVGGRSRGQTEGVYLQPRRGARPCHPALTGDPRWARPAVPACPGRENCARSPRRHPRDLSGWQPRVQQHRLQVPAPDGGLAEGEAWVGPGRSYAARRYWGFGRRLYGERRWTSLLSRASAVSAPRCLLNRLTCSIGTNTRCPSA